MNRLFYGDNLDIMREKIATDTIDLVYLDPPFTSDLNYNVLFKAEGLHADDAQVTAFKDTWTWDEAAQATYDELQNVSNVTLVNLVNALRTGLDRTPMLAYLVNMSIRLIEIDRVLKPTGSVAAAQMLARRWIGVDISPFAIELIRKQRLEGAFPHLQVGVDYKIEGLPTTLEGARMMAQEDKVRKGFEIWVVSKIDGIPNDKKGAAKGVDGRIPFKPDGKTTKFAIVSVKSGKLKADDVRSLMAVAKREEPSSLGFGMLVVLNPPTAGVKTDAASAGTVEMHGHRYPLIQILTVDEILKGKKLHLPLPDPTVAYRKKANLADIQGSLLPDE
jgi:hypothetical protein